MSNPLQDQFDSLVTAAMDAPDSEHYLRNYKKVQGPYSNLLKQVNMTLRQASGSDDKKRVQIASCLVGRTLLSTYDLTIGEARAIVRACKNGSHPDQDFVEYMKSIAKDKP